jgi:septal ring factor EnvC (AmiA/AmiB activator)
LFTSVKPFIVRPLARPFFASKKPLLIALSLVMLGAAPSHAEDQKATERQLGTLKKEIQQIQAALKKDRSKENQAQSALADTERALSDLQVKLDQLDEQLGTLNQDLGQFQAEKAELEQSIAAQKEAVMDLIRQQYRLGHQPRLYMLLNQRDPERISRMSHYYDHFTKAQAEVIDRYQDTLASLQKTQVGIDQTQASLVANREALAKELESQKSLKSQRANQVAALKKQVKNRQSELAKKQADQKRLEALLAKIIKSVEAARLEQNNKAFKTLKGQLNWPIKGRVLTGYGSGSDNITSDGLVIEGSIGQAVKAVHHGRVVFSDWLRGYGLLLIIDHGDGYMSLYGHNDALKKTTGDWVQQGETISSVGQSGGYSRPALYFAVRYKGKSVDPISWLSKR